MTNNTLPTYHSIDWLQLWQNARKQQGNRSKSAKDWDKKAPGFGERNRTSPFIDLLLERLPASDQLTVLDVGCGPGNLALPLSQRVKHVTAIDFSPQMLRILGKEVTARNISNITITQCAWEDDWSTANIEKHDIAIASRSLGVEDLPAAIEKLNAYAIKSVFIVDRIAPTPYAPEAFEAVGRRFSPGPDYIYTVNILYSMGIHPNVEILELPATGSYSSLDEAFRAYSWMLKYITEEEEERLLTFLSTEAQVNEDGTVTIQRRHPLRWALIWYHTNNSTTSNSILPPRHI